MQSMKINIQIKWLAFAMIAMSAACTREVVESNGKNPYGDPVLPSIIFAENSVNPAKGYVNDEVLIRGTGFLKHKDKLEVMFNSEKAEIIEATDTSVKVKIPAMGSSGAINVRVGDEFYYGPFFQVFGGLQMDTFFRSQPGANALVTAIIPANDDKYFIAGRFNNYDNANKVGGTNRAARILATGAIDNAWNMAIRPGRRATFTRPFTWKANKNSW